METEGENVCQLQGLTQGGGSFLTSSPGEVLNKEADELGGAG